MKFRSLTLKEFINYKKMCLIYIIKFIIWLRHYATRWKVLGSIFDKVSGLFSIYLILPGALWP
jgi:hypothetical protein